MSVWEAVAIGFIFLGIFSFVMAFIDRHREAHGKRPLIDMWDDKYKRH